jgi:hypothetical protein
MAKRGRTVPGIHSMAFGCGRKQCAGTARIREVGPKGRMTEGRRARDTRFAGTRSPRRSAIGRAPWRCVGAARTFSAGGPGSPRKIRGSIFVDHAIFSVLCGGGARPRAITWAVTSFA